MTARFQCGFEESEQFCSFIQDKTDSPKNPTNPPPDLTQPGASFDWDRRCGATPTQNTGPASGAGESACFAYIETSDPQAANDQARCGDDAHSSCLGCYMNCCFFAIVWMLGFMYMYNQIKRRTCVSFSVSTAP